MWNLMIKKTLQNIIEGFILYIIFCRMGGMFILYIRIDESSHGIYSLRMIFWIVLFWRYLQSWYMHLSVWHLRIDLSAFSAIRNQHSLPTNSFRIRNKMTRITTILQRCLAKKTLHYSRISRLDLVAIRLVLKSCPS